MYAQHAHGSRNLRIIGKHHAPISKSAEIFGWIEGEYRCISCLGDTNAALFCTDGLSCIYNELKVVSFTYLLELPTIDHLAKKVYRQQRTRAWGDSLLDSGNVYVKGAEIDIHKHGAGTNEHNRLTRCAKGEGRSDDLITRLNTASA